MGLIVDEIFVGECNRSMGVLSSSLPKDISQTLASHLDLPGQVPPGFSLETYISGALIGDSYVLARISSDPAAERAGMVFSHAYIIKSSDLKNVVDIQPLINLLQKSRPSELLAAQRDLDLESKTSPPTVPGGICDMLTHPTGQTVVVTDAAYFELITTGIWASMLPVMRQDFKFGISFDPAEALQQALHFALVPASTLPLWPTIQRADEVDEKVLAQTASGKHLSSSDKGELGDFCDKLGIERASFSDLGLLGRAYELWSLSNPKFENALAASRIVGKFQPSPVQGIDVKRSLLDKVLDENHSHSPEEVLALRNFDWSPFPMNARDDDAFMGAFNSALQETNSSTALRDLIESVFDECSANELWRVAGQRMLRAAAGSAARTVAKLAWGVFAENPDVGLRLLKSVPSEQFDSILASAISGTADLPTAEFGLSLVEQGYFLTEVAHLKKRHGNNNIAALAEACERDQEVFSDLAIKAILKSASKADVVAAALSNDNDRVNKAAAVAISETPTLLRAYDLSRTDVQHLWNNSLLVSPHAWKIEDKPALQARLFSLLSQEGIALSLLARLMSTPLGNWLDFKDRGLVWGLLDSDSEEIALVNTAKAWITSYPSASCTGAFFDPEQRLKEVIARPTMNLILLEAISGSSFERAIKCFFGNDRLTEGGFIFIFNSLYKREADLAVDQSKKLGYLLSVRQWKHATRTIFSRYGSLSNLRPMFEICAGHLALWDQFRHNLVSPSYSDLRSLFVDVACELYSHGPTDRHVWERAGGDLAQLNLKGSGHAQWSSAEMSMHKGNDINIREVIATMMEDYPVNAQLTFLWDSL